MNLLQRAIDVIDRFQRRHRFTAFSYGVIKKYGDDQAGYQAALLTYYGFLSLFPLLLVLTTVASILAGSNQHLQETIVRSTTSYFPMLGNQLSNHIQTIHKSGWALAAGIVFTLYGARGVADAFRNGVNDIWAVPKTRRDGFPKSLAKSLILIIVGGIGLIAASLLAGYAATFGHGVWARAISLLVNVFILFWLFIFLLNVTLPHRITLKQLRSAALASAIGLVVLQAAGTYLLTRELKNLDALYSYFAVSLGLLFWIYLQAQVVYYSIEIASVKAHRLWPRSLNTNNLTAADKRVLGGRAHKEKAVLQEEISTDFTER